jgi:lipopolysaccharide transport system permease protein
MIKSIWDYRYFIFSSIKTEFQSHFARSKLGGLWIILHPLAQIIIYAFVLSQIMKAKFPGIDNQYAYPVYILFDMIVWTLFFEVLGRSLTVFINNGNLLKKQF